MKLPANNLLVLLILCFAFIIPTVVSAIPQTVLLISGSDTQSAGYTSTLPPNPLDTSSYNRGGWSSASATSMSGWYSASQAPFGSGASWVSSASTTEGGIEDQWRLFKIDFDIPVGSTINSAQLWYTSDNAVSVSLNDAEISSNGVVYGDAPSPQPYLFQNSYSVNFNPVIGSNTLKFVVRNWNGDVTYNPTGLLYKGVIEYENQPPVAAFDAAPIKGSTPLKVTFTDKSTGDITSKVWQNKLNTDSTWTTFTLDKKSSYTFVNGGVYDVKLTVSGSGGSDDEIKTNYITVTCPKCKVEVWAHPVVANRYHTLVVYTDQTGKQTFYQAQPTNNPPHITFRPFTIDYGPIRVETGSFNPKSSVWPRPMLSALSLSGLEAYEKNKCLNANLTRIGNLNIPYKPLGPNSNTVTHSILHDCNCKDVLPTFYGMSFSSYPGWNYGFL